MASEESASILESALSESFSPPPLKRQSLLALAQPEVNTGGATQESDASVQPNPSGSQSVDVEAWKSEYEEQVKEWRAQNAEAREKAEKERARWEAVREKEKAEGVSQPVYEEPGWQTVGGHKSLATSTVSASELSSPSPADVRDLVSGEVPKYTEPSTSHSRQDTGDDSQKWEDLPSDVTSSFPSMSFPGSNEGHSSPEHKPPSHSHPAPVAPTIAVFDSSLSTGTRVKALFASLAINLLLPFVNGVMLGFGEIFAKNVVLGWFGWKTPATRVGLSSLRRR